MLIYTSTLLLWVAIAQPINARTADIVAAHDMAAAVSLNAMVVGADGTIEATLRNNTGRKVGDVEVLVEYAWIWAQDFNHGDDDPGYSTKHTLPVELTPGASMPVNIPPLYPPAERDDGSFLISAKVVGYTRFRWVTPHDRP
jgi:hypothetical protein